VTSPPLAQYYSGKDGDGRRYRNPFTGELLPSVTTILKESPKNLEQWAANLTMEWAVENWMSLGNMSNEKGMRAGKYRWKDVANERAEVGDGVHSTIEAEHKGLWEYPELDEEQQQIIEQWEQLKMVHKIEPVHTELTAWYSGHFAGTMDGLWVIDGKLTLIDIKTSKSHWPEHDWQISALAHAPKALLELVPNPDPKNKDHWKEIDNPAHVSKIDGAALIHLRSDFWEIIPVKHIEENYKVFASLEQTWYAKKHLEEVKKKEEVNG
jgi:hypothetical protein